MKEIKKENSNTKTGLLIMRITSGLFFVMFGAMKLMGLSGFAEKYLGVFGGAAMAVAVIVALAELLAGLALLTGVYLKWASYILAGVMLGSIFLAHNFFVDPSQMMTGLTRVVLIGYYVGLAQLVNNYCPFTHKEI